MRSTIFFVSVCAALLLGLSVLAHRAAAQETFNSNSGPTPPGESYSGNGGNSAPTGTQGQVGNGFCPPPVIVVNGVTTTPLNWSCGQTGGTQNQHWGPLWQNACDESKGDYSPIACDRQRCQHNPDLTVCAQFPPTPPGTKNISRTPPATPQTPPPGPLDVPAIQIAMTGCLHQKLAYIPVQPLQPRYMLAARLAFVASAPYNTPFAELAPAAQIALNEYAMALQVSGLYYSLYGSPSKFDSDQYENFYVMGWLDYCLENAGLVPKGDPRIRLGAFLGVPMRLGGGPITDGRINAFANGFNWGGVIPPVSLIPPPGP